MNEAQRIAVVIDLGWPYKRHLEVFDGINRYASKVNWDTVMLPLSETTMTNRTKWPFDGMVGRFGDAIASRVKRARVPLVNVWLNSPAKNVSGVYPDWESAGVMAADHLIARGFRHFHYLGFSRDRGVERQLKGFRSTLHESGFDCKWTFVGQNYTRTLDAWEKFSGRLNALTHSLARPVGICVSDDLLGRFVLDACQREGFSVPYEVAVLSMNNESLICNNSQPSLSSIDVGYPQIGWKAAELLDKMMQSNGISKQTILHPPDSLVLRQSTDAFTVDDPKVAAALRFIANNSHSGITVNDVANHCDISRRSLERGFQQFLNRTVASEITRMRLDRTKRQLMESDESIKTIAYRNGFKNASHLCTVFRRECGLTPGEYRIQHSLGQKT